MIAKNRRYYERTLSSQSHRNVTVMPEVLTVTGIGWGIAALAAWAVEGSNSSWWITPPPSAPPFWNGDASAEYECRWWTVGNECIERDSSYSAHRRTTPSSETWHHARYCALKNNTGCVLSHEMDSNAPYGFFTYDSKIADLRFYSQPDLHVDIEDRVEIQVYEPTHALRPTTHEMYRHIQIEHVDSQSLRLFRIQAEGELAYCAQLLNLSTCHKA